MNSIEQSERQSIELISTPAKGRHPCVIAKRSRERSAFAQSEPYLRRSCWAAHMSTGFDARGRPDIWSYISFGSISRRRSVSLPYRANSNDPFEKANRHSAHPPSNGSSNLWGNIKYAWMTQSQRSRYLKTGGILVFVVLIFLYTSSADRRRVKGFGGGMCPRLYAFPSLTTSRPFFSRCLLPFRKMYKTLRLLETSHPIRIDDRRWQHRLSHSCLQIQQLRTFTGTRR